MRPLETYLVIACAVGVVWPALFGVRTRRGVMAAVLVGLVVLQWQVEGYRWPLFLLYVVAVGMAVGDVVAVERELPWARRVGRFLFGPLGLLFAVAPAFLFPVPELPVPSGPLQIGTETLTLRHPDILLGASTRAALFLLRLSRVWAAAAGRDFVLPDDVKQLAVPVLAHRMALRPEAVIRGSEMSQVIAEILDHLEVPGTVSRSTAS